MVKKWFLLVLLIAPIEIFSLSTVELTTNTSLLIAQDQNKDKYKANFFGVGSGLLTFETPSSEAVKALIGIFFSIGSENGTPIFKLEIPRLFISVRAKYFKKNGDESEVRFTTGRTRVSLGHGDYFRAADVLFGYYPAKVDFNASRLRDETLWMFNILIPFTYFSFMEIFTVIPILDSVSSLAIPLTKADVANANILGYTLLHYNKINYINFKKDVQSGFRIQWEMFNNPTMEIGYLYKRQYKENVSGYFPFKSFDGGEDRENLHSAYFSMQFNAYFDFYFSISMEVPQTVKKDEAKDGLAISAGITDSYKFGNAGSFSFEIESLYLGKSNRGFLFGSLSVSPEGVYDIFTNVIWGISDKDLQFAIGSNLNMVQNLKISLSLGLSGKDLSNNKPAVSFNMYFDYIF